MRSFVGIPPALVALATLPWAGPPAWAEDDLSRFMPPDTEMTAISRTIGNDQLVDEMIFKFTHTIRMDWMLPGIAPTGKRVEVPLVAIVRFREGKLAHEHIYWDQASVLAQIGLIDAAILPVAGVESARKVLDPTLPANALMRRADRNQ